MKEGGREERKRGGEEGRKEGREERETRPTKMELSSFVFSHYLCWFEAQSLSKVAVISMLHSMAQPN